MNRHTPIRIAQVTAGICIPFAIVAAIIYATTPETVEDVQQPGMTYEEQVEFNAAVEKLDKALHDPQYAQTVRNENTAKLASIYEAISARQLIAEFERNTIAAGREYNGKLLQVRGWISKIDTAPDGRPFIEMSNPDSYTHSTLICYFNDENDLLKSNKGDTITFTGVCSGKTHHQVILTHGSFPKEWPITPPNHSTPSTKSTKPTPSKPAPYQSIPTGRTETPITTKPITPPNPTNIREQARTQAQTDTQRRNAQRSTPPH